MDVVRKEFLLFVAMQIADGGRKEEEEEEALMGGVTQKQQNRQVCFSCLLVYRIAPFFSAWLIAC